MQVSKPLLQRLAKSPIRLKGASILRGRLPVPFPSLDIATSSLLSVSDDNQNNLLDRSIQNRSYHATTVTALPIRKRRRRRGDPGGVPEEDEKAGPTTREEHEPLENYLEFEEKALECLDKFTMAVEPMIAINDPFVVTRTSNKLQITLDKSLGSYEVETEPDERLLIFRSPVSGAHSYFYSTKTHAWLDVNDLHSLEGLFVRDLIRHCKGVPRI